MKDDFPKDPGPSFMTLTAIFVGAVVLFLWLANMMASVHIRVESDPSVPATESP